jgi:copper homeostasis protein
MESFLLEIACYSAESAMIAQNAGAQRIELCDNPADGGTTPSFGVLKVARENINIPIYPIIRPRGGHFVFSETEIEMMRRDIVLCKQLGFEGVVIGILNNCGQIHYDITAKLTELAYPMEVTFHRAFDRTIDPFEALETIILAGCTRILTSGQVPCVQQATTLIASLIQAADHRIIIMPGSGIRSSNISLIAKETGAMEFHSSAGKWVEESFFTPQGMQEKLAQWKTDPSEINTMLQQLNQYFKVERSDLDPTNGFFFSGNKASL